METKTVTNPPALDEARKRLAALTAESDQAAQAAKAFAEAEAVEQKRLEKELTEAGELASRLGTVDPESKEFAALVKQQSEGAVRVGAFRKRIELAAKERGAAESRAEIAAQACGGVRVDVAAGELLVLEAKVAAVAEECERRLFDMLSELYAAWTGASRLAEHARRPAPRGTQYLAAAGEVYASEGRNREVIWAAFGRDRAAALQYPRLVLEQRAQLDQARARAIEEFRKNRTVHDGSGADTTAPRYLVVMVPGMPMRGLVGTPFVKAGEGFVAPPGFVPGRTLIPLNTAAHAAMTELELEPVAVPYVAPGASAAPRPRPEPGLSLRELGEAGLALARAKERADQP